MSFWDNNEVSSCLLQCASTLRDISLRGKSAAVEDIQALMNTINNLRLAIPNEPCEELRRNSLTSILHMLEAVVTSDRNSTFKDDSISTQHSVEVNVDGDSDLCQTENDSASEARGSSSESADREVESSGSHSTASSCPPVSDPSVSGKSDSHNSNSTEKGSGDQLDSFLASRRDAIEGTIATDVKALPKLTEIAGLHEAKNALYEALVDPIQYSEWFSAAGLKPWKAVLLFGPPGTGKTALSQAIAREIKAVLYQISSSDLISSWSGQSEKLIRELFSHAIAQKKTSIIFIDEVDSLCRARSANEDDGNRRVKTELLVQIQRLQDTSQVVLICATNCPWDLDPAFLRRFEKKIYVGLPDTDARLYLLQKRLKKTALSSNVSMQWLADATEGFSGDDLRRFTSELAYTQLRLFKEERRHNGEANVRVPLLRPHVDEVLARFQPSVDDMQLARFQQYMNK